MKAEHRSSDQTTDPSPTTREKITEGSDAKKAFYVKPELEYYDDLHAITGSEFNFSPF